MSILIEGFGWRLGLVLGWLAIGIAPAQEEGTAAASREAPTPAEVEAELASLEAGSLEEAVKTPLEERLRGALDQLAKAEEERAEANALSQLVVEAPERLKEIESELAQLAEEPRPVPSDADSEALRAELEQARARVAELEARQREVVDEAARVAARPGEIGSRRSALRQRQAELQAEVGAAPGEDASPGERVRDLAVRAELAAVEAELARLDEEEMAQASRERLLQARQEMLSKQLALERGRAELIEARLNRELVSEAQQLNQQLERLADSAGPGLDPLVNELRGLRTQLAGETRKAVEIASAERQVGEELEELRTLDRRLREQVELGGLDGSFGRVLMVERQRLPQPRALKQELQEIEERISETRLEHFEVGQQLEEQARLEEELGDLDGAESLLELRVDLLGQLDTLLRAKVRELGRLESERRRYLELLEGFNDYMMQQLFWVRSSPPVELETFSEVGDGARWMFGPARVSEGVRALARVPLRHPFATSLVGLALLALLVFRRRIKRSLEDTGRRIRRISTDRMVYTLRALLDSVLLTLPLPLVFAYLAWAIGTEVDPSAWSRGLALGFHVTAPLLFGLLLWREVGRSGGLGVAHFGWRAELTQRTRRLLHLLTLSYLPALLLLALSFYEPSMVAFNGLGRLAFIVAQVVLGWVLWRALHPRDGIFVDLYEAQDARLFSRGRFLWFGLALAVPLALVMAALAGYVLTGLVVSELLIRSMLVAAAGGLVYGLLQRAFTIKQRRIALQEALAERRARREAEAHPEEESAGERVTVEDEEVELELDDVVRQTRRLLRSLVTVSVLLVVASMWGAALPLDEAAGDATVAGELNLLDLVRAAVVIIVAATLIRNLPGLLDLAGLRNSGLDPGTRYALTTLVQYALIAIAIGAVFAVLELDWSRFGWIAAALSVGLGFGLQEIVANFVCGIILLFERPIRVGDIVTLGEVTGTVSRIRMRATTITNWDRQDFVVPNKDLVTGTFINWTLTGPLNRVSLPVGVAYGSDTVRAREIFAEIAAEHPVILDDPAPLISFDSFGDSTLDLVFRFYLPNLDNRLKIITEVHEEIDRRFKEEGIEIAFPQRDLHLRSVDPSVPVPGRGGAGPPEPVRNP